MCNQPLQVEAITLPASSSSSVTDSGSGSGNGSDGLLDDMGLAALTAAKEPHCCKLFTVGSSSDDGVTTGSPSHYGRASWRHRYGAPWRQLGML